ncbi:MAG: DUF2207 domain-containing protein, partial [bacterium]|nr:DUF2207 domain-containing protein [bacterium]
AAEEVEDMTLEELERAQAELHDDFEAFAEGLPHCQKQAIAEFQQRMEKAYDDKSEELSQSREINEAASEYPKDPPPGSESSCGGSSAPPPEVLPALEIAPEDAEQVLETEQRLREEVEDYEPRDDLLPITCESHGCDGYFNGRGERWFCDELVGELPVGPERHWMYGGVEVDEAAYGGGQLGYAAWGNSVSVTLKVAEEGASTAAKATMDIVGKSVGGVGIAAGVVDLGLCAVRWRKTSNRIDALKELLDTYSTASDSTKKIEKKITQYALKKKKAKLNRTKVAAGAAVLGVVGGIIGVTALASNPVGWSIALGLGIAAVLGGAGLLIWRGVRKRRQKKRADLYRRRLLSCLYDLGEPEDTNADVVLSKIEAHERCWVNRRSRKTVDLVLKGFTREREKNQRQIMASAIIGMFFEETRVLEAGELESDEIEDIIRDSFAGAILAALNLKPEKMHEKLVTTWEEDGDNRQQPKTRKLAAKWVEQVMGKLKSW